MDPAKSTATRCFIPPPGELSSSEDTYRNDAEPVTQNIPCPGAYGMLSAKRVDEIDDKIAQGRLFQNTIPHSSPDSSSMKPAVTRTENASFTLEFLCPGDFSDKPLDGWKPPTRCTPSVKRKLDTEYDDRTSIYAYKATLEKIFQLADQGISLGVDLTSTEVVNWDVAAEEVSFIPENEPQESGEPTTYFDQLNQLIQKISSIQEVLEGNNLREKGFLLQVATTLKERYLQIWDTMREGTLEKNVLTVVTNLLQFILAISSQPNREYTTSDDEVQTDLDKSLTVIDFYGKGN